MLAVHDWVPCAPDPTRTTCLEPWLPPPLQYIYADALHDLAVERVKRQRAGAPPSELRGLEAALVTISLDLIRFELEAGQTERAIARVQV